VAGALLGVCFGFAGKLNVQRRDLDLVRMELPAQARPDLLTNVLLSVGRALAVDYLWIGLENMKQQGRYFDAMQRAEWICQLQPHFPSVWIFQAWNMSYNISVAMTTGEDRWRWVKNGIELLRDRGIPLNPKSIAMYQQLAWIFHHKVGGLSDDWHWYYKIQLARAMEPIVGHPDRGEKYDLMAQAPENETELLEVPKMKEFLDAFRKFKLDPFEDFFRILSNRDEYGEKVVALMDDPDYEHCRRMLEGFLRAQRLKNEWKMDIKIIAELRDKDMYGPLDFRTPQAHAIYWANKAFKVVGQDTSFDALSNDRVIYRSLQDLVRRGRFIITPEGRPLIAPDIRFIPVADRVYLSLGKKYAEAEGKEWDGTAGETFRSGHVNFLRKGIQLYYQYGNYAMAEKYWKKLKKLYPNPEYNVTMERYVYDQIMEDMEGVGMVDANATIVFFLVQAYRRYAMDDDYSAVAMERLAKRLYDFYMKDHRWKGPTERVGLPPWKNVVADARAAALRDLPDQMKERLRRKLGLKESGSPP